MPVTIKTNTIKYRKPNGDYEDFNAIAQQSTAAQIAAIQQKGLQTIASVPDDYTTLANNVSQLSEEIDVINGTEILTGWVNGYYINTKGETVDLSSPTSSGSWRYVVVDCQSGDAFTINGHGTDKPRLWAFIDSSNNVLSVADQNATGDYLVIYAPANTAKLILNDNVKTLDSYSGIFLKKRISDAEEILSFLNDEHHYNFTVTANSGYYVEETISSGKMYEFDVINVVGNYDYVQAYCFRADGTYEAVRNANNQNRWYIGDSVKFTPSESFAKFRCYVYLAENADSVTVDFGFYEVNPKTYTDKVRGLIRDVVRSSSVLPINESRLPSLLGITSMDALPINTVYFFYDITSLTNQPESTMRGVVFSFSFNREYGQAGIIQVYASKSKLLYRVSTGTYASSSWGPWQAQITLNNTTNRTTCKIFRKVVCCGDSYTSGHIVDGSGVAHSSNPNYAWPHYMETMTGNAWVNCGVSGSNCLTWQTSPNGLAKAQASGKAQAYVIGLGINDEASDTDRYVPVGTAADIGTDAQTYYGGISAIIRALATINPDAHIFVNTNPNIAYSDLPARDATVYNEAIRTIVSTYSGTYNVHLIDLAADYIDMYTNSSLMSGVVSRHFTASGYEQFAEIYAYVLSDYINKHITAFNDVAFIDYDE